MKHFVLFIWLVLIFPTLSCQDLDMGSLKVVGKAKSALVPDVVTITFQFNVRDKSSSNAQNNLILETNKLISRLGRLGYGNNDVRLLSMNIEEDWDYTGEKTKKIGFLATNEVELSMQYDPLKISQLIDSIRNSNLKYLEYSLKLEISEKLKNSVRDKLIIEAIENAKSRAKIIAKSANVVLDGIIKIEYRDLIFNMHSNADIPPPPPPSVDDSRASARLSLENVSLKELEAYEEVIIYWNITNVR